MTNEKLSEIESRWNACHPANGEDDVHMLISEVRRLVSKISRCACGESMTEANASCVECWYGGSDAGD